MKNKELIAAIKKLKQETDELPYDTAYRILHAGLNVFLAQAEAAEELKAQKKANKLIEKAEANK